MPQAVHQFQLSMSAATHSGTEISLQTNYPQTERITRPCDFAMTQSNQSNCPSIFASHICDVGDKPFNASAPLNANLKTKIVVPSNKNAPNDKSCVAAGK